MSVRIGQTITYQFLSSGSRFTAPFQRPVQSCPPMLYQLSKLFIWSEASTSSESIASSPDGYFMEILTPLVTHHYDSARCTLRRDRWEVQIVIRILFHVQSITSTFKHYNLPGVCVCVCVCLCLCVFLVADTQLFKRLCPSVGRAVGPSISSRKVGKRAF